MESGKSKKRKHVASASMVSSSSGSSSSNSSISSTPVRTHVSASGHGRHHRSGRTHGHAHGHDYDSKLNYLVQKILVYSHKNKTNAGASAADLDPNIGAANATSKYAKYLNQLRTHTYLLPLVSGFGTGAGEYVEVKLRKAGVLEAMMLVVRNVVDAFKQNASEGKAEGVEDNEAELDPEEKEIKERVEILSNSLSILANCFARDPHAREDAFKCSVPLILNNILKLDPRTTRINLEIQAKALKCVGNLATEKQCRLQTLSRGLGSTILNLLHAVAGSKNPDLPKPSLSNSKPVFDSAVAIPLVSNAVRAIRILCADPESRTMLWRLNALVILGEVLVWNDDRTSTIEHEFRCSLTTEVLKTLNVLSVRFRIAPAEALYEFKADGEPILQKLVDTLKYSKTHKILSLVTHILTNLSSLKEIVPRLINMKIYDALFVRLGEETEIPVLDDLVRLLQGLIMDDSVVCKYLLPYSPQIFATIKVLRIPALEKYHKFILTLFQNLLGGGLETLVENGLMDLLDELLQSIYQTCTFESFSKRISSLDDTICPVHTICEYKPVYRCTSPTYLEVQEEVEKMLSAREFLERINTPKRNSSAGCSPAHSWGSTSTSGFGSDGGYNSDAVYSPSTSSGRTSPVSSIESDEELADSSTTGELIFSEHRTEFSDIEVDEQEPEEPQQPPSVEVEDTEATEEPSASASTSRSEVPHKKRRMEYESECQAKTEKMVLIIDILKNITFLKPFRTNLLRFTPTFMNILCDGKMNCIRYEVQQTPDRVRDPTVILNKQLFYGSHRMLQEFFADIYNYSFIIEQNLIPLLHRLILLGGHDDDAKPAPQKNSELHKCNELLKNLLVVLTGETNQTIGWRAGFMNQNLISASTSTSTTTSSSSIKDKVAIVIPLLHQIDCYSFRGYQLKSGAWTTLFKILENMDRHDGQLFQDCITSISTLCRTLGLKWTEHATYGERPQLLSKNLNNERTSNMDENSIVIQFDCGDEICTNKQLLTDASPVFAVMFDGRFREANQEKVKLTNVPRNAMVLLIDELQNKATSEPETENADTKPPRRHLQIKTLFELLSLSNQYMLEDIQSRTINTIIAACLCPYSAAEIYKHIVKQLYQKVDPTHAELNARDLTHLVLKYLLVGPGLGPNLQYRGFRKIFDTIEPQIVLADLNSFFERFSNNVLTTPPPLRRNSTKQKLKFQ